MYNFRYHLVTIVAIFAALALGLLLGVAITGSDLVRDASSNLAESLVEQFDELNETNEALGDQLETEQLLSAELLRGWQADRLTGRTVVILTRSPATNDPVTTELVTLITRSGGVAATVRIDPSQGLLSSGEQATEQLKELKTLLPEHEGEPYETTLARALAHEWSSTAQGGSFPTEESIGDAYPLTTWLVKEKRIEVSVSYEPVLTALGMLGVSGASGATEAGAAPEVPGSALAGLVASTRATYEFAEKLQLPYAANGVIDAAVVVPSEGAQPLADPIALQIALEFDRRGTAGELPYAHLAASGTSAAGTTGTEAGAEGAEDTKPTEDGAAAEGAADAEAAGAAGTGDEAAAEGRMSVDANYYALLVQQGEYAEALLKSAQDTGLPCVLSPLDQAGRYATVALLSGATKGTYALGRNGIKPFPPVPNDPTGNKGFTAP
ncbi:MAG: copper transporter [Coriobacteriales bacterium]|jgi:hypothetical protein|nr:copper transporter [Coriobacteriales bacterium]